MFYAETICAMLFIFLFLSSQLHILSYLFKHDITNEPESKAKSVAEVTFYTSVIFWQFCLESVFAYITNSTSQGRVTGLIFLVMNNTGFDWLIDWLILMACQPV